MSFAIVTLKKGEGRTLKAGGAWIYDNEIGSITGDFTDGDMAGCVLSETVLTSSDLSASENLASARYDNDTVWPDDDMLPDGFDSVCRDDLSALKDDEETSDGDY